ncbi:MAG TPA: hypothetical protein VI389_06935, partial [Geobacteraceae bacterium]
MTSDVQEAIVRKGMDIFRLMEAEPPAVFKKSWWVGQVLEMTMRDPLLKLNLFRFIDVLPTLTSTDLVMAHIDEYFRDLPAEATLPLRALFAGGKAVSGALAARLLTRNIVAIARTFIAGESPEEARKPLQALIGEGRSVTFDILGETALSEKEAQGYAGQY